MNLDKLKEMILQAAKVDVLIVAQDALHEYIERRKDPHKYVSERYGYHSIDSLNSLRIKEAIERVKIAELLLMYVKDFC